MGTIIAWVLVRDRLPRQERRQLAHRPALRPAHDRRRPDAAGPVRPEQPVRPQPRLHPGRHLVALLFVTLPFVVRSVQPVLLELDREMEEAAASLGAGRLHHLPPHHPAQPGARDPGRQRPGLRPRARRVRLAGADLGQHPVQDRGRVGQHHRPDRGRPRRRGRRGLGVPARDLAGLAAPAVGASSAGRRAMPARAPTSARSATARRPAGACASSRSATSAAPARRRVACVFYRTFEHGFDTVLDGRPSAGGAPRLLADGR